jgi:uncharacterized YccA/Bax inhibitor family protein
MTLNGIILKSFFCLLLTSLSVWYVWNLVEQHTNIKWYITGGFIVAIFFSVLTSYKKSWAPITVPIYALAKGLFLGGISAYANNQFDGLAMKAVNITIYTFFVMLILYKFKIVKVTQQFRSIIYTAIATIMTIYIVSFIFRLFGIKFTLIYGTSWFSIGFTIVAACVAAFSLLLDFNYIERKINKAPKYKEWIATWGILVSLFWLYFEVLRLLKKLAIRY